MKKVAIFGSTGFIGTAVADHLESSCSVIRLSTSSSKSSNNYAVDLTDKQSIETALRDIQPDVIISCAGKVGQASDSFALNRIFTENILESAGNLSKKPERILLCGSASVYGVVDRLPVSEEAPINGTSEYAVSKIEEERVALELGKSYNIPVIIARIFNPIGLLMDSKFLLPSLISQIKAIQRGQKDKIAVGRLDSCRDYLDIKDLAVAVGTLATHPLDTLHYRVYNIGSGRATTTKQLADMVARSMMSDNEAITSLQYEETMDIAEPQLASQADIHRLTHDTGWKPTVTLADAVDAICRYNKPRTT